MDPIEKDVQRQVITDRLRAAMPGSFAAGQIPVEVVMNALAPLVDEIADLRVRVAELEAKAPGNEVFSMTPAEWCRHMGGGEAK